MKTEILSGILASLGGAYLSFGFGGSFNENMTNGRGYIALAAVILGKWNPLGALAACLLFGFGFALSIPLQREADISANLVSTLPYVLTLIALVGVIGRSRPPAAVGRPDEFKQPTDPVIANFLHPVIDLQNPRFKQLEHSHE